MKKVKHASKAGRKNPQGVGVGSDIAPSLTTYRKEFFVVFDEDPDFQTDYYKEPPILTAANKEAVPNLDDLAKIWRRNLMKPCRLFSWFESRAERADD